MSENQKRSPLAVVAYVLGTICVGAGATGNKAVGERAFWIIPGSLFLAAGKIVKKQDAEREAEKRLAEQLSMKERLEEEGEAERTHGQEPSHEGYCGCATFNENWETLQQEKKWNNNLKEDAARRERAARGDPKAIAEIAEYEEFWRTYPARREAERQAEREKLASGDPEAIAREKLRQEKEKKSEIARIMLAEHLAIVVNGDTEEIERVTAEISQKLDRLKGSPQKE